MRDRRNDASSHRRRYDIPQAPLSAISDDAETMEEDNDDQDNDDDFATHHTPKADNKRRLLSTTNSFDCSTLQRSLKRVRLTTHIGELRLQKDIRYAVHHHNWTELPATTEEYAATRHTVGGGGEVAWRINDECKVVMGRDCMELQMRIGDVFRYTLQFPPMYPHQPPTIEANTSVSLVIVNRPDQETTRRPVHERILREWSPICRLTDVCEWILQFHRENYANKAFAAPTESFFRPGRFNVGYYDHKSATAADGLKHLQNSNTNSTTTITRIPMDEDFGSEQHSMEY